MAGEGQGPIVVPCVLVNGVPYSLVVDANKYPYVNFADGLKTADLNITASKELAVLLTALVGAVETSLVAFPGGILKTAKGYGDLTRAETAGIIASNATFTTVIDTSATGILEGLDFSSDYEDSELSLEVDDEPIQLNAGSGSVLVNITPTILNGVGGESCWYKEDLYDTENNRHYFHLKRAVQFNSRLRVRVRQQSGADKNIAVQVWYRSIGQP